MRIQHYAWFLEHEHKHEFVEDDSDLTEIENTDRRPPPRIYSAPRLNREGGARIELFDDLAMELRPDQPFLVEGIFSYGSLAGIFGLPGVGKSQLLLDLAFSILTGSDWFGRKVKQGPVLYVPGEGFGGLNRRILAIKDARNIRGCTGLAIASEMVQIGANGQPDIDELIKAINSEMPEPPVLIMLDTLSQAMGGDDENSTGAMSGAMRTAGRLQRTTGSTVLISHHSPWGGQRERGSIAFRAALDTLLQIKKTDAGLTLSCEKQRDLEPFADLHFKLTRRLDSVVVTPFLSAEQKRAVSEARATQSDVALRVLQELGGSSVTTTDWKSACEKTGVPGSTFHDVQKRLVTQGLVVKLHAGANVLNSISANGTAALGIG